MATYEDIQRANSEMTLTPIKGKNYAEVPEKVEAFRKLYPNGAIVSEIVSLEKGVVVMKATVYDDTGKVLGTGHAYEVEGSSFINKGSYIENCETSAWGRALSACGFTGGTSVASYEEAANAKLGQEKIDDDEKSKLVGYAKDKGVPMSDILGAFKLKRLDDMTRIDYVKAVRRLNEMR